MPEKPVSLKGLRVRLVSPASDKLATKEQAAYVKLKKLLAKHGQHLSKKTLWHFRQSLNALLLHGLRARPLECPEDSEIRFKASDGKLYAASAKAWPEVQKRDPGARQVAKNAAVPRTELKKPLHERSFEQALSKL